MKNAGFRSLNDERGAALLIVLLMVVVLGLAVGIAGSTWKTISQRAREAELFWRGDQYRKAIKSYNEVRHGGGGGLYPRKLEDLVKDPRSLAAVRHLRRLYPDPMTGGEWDLVKDKSGRIIGVRSSSGLEPFRQDGFPTVYEKFNGSESYSRWEFVYEPEKKSQAQPQTKATSEEGT